MGKLYSSAKVLRFADRIDALVEDRPAAPVHVRIKPTNVCNHNCWFCAYRTGNVSLGEDMNLRDKIPAEKMREITADLIAMGVKAVTFSGGGEPLIYPGIADTVAELAGAGIRIGALTNASRLKGKAAQAFADHGTWLRVSIDGWDGESYAKYRGVKDDAFEQVIENLAAFAALKSDCVLGASIIVDKDNAAHIHTLATRLKQAGVSHVKISPCIISNSGVENNAYHAPFYDTVRREVNRTARDLNSDTFAVVDHYHQLEECFDKDYDSCPFARFLTVIGADLKVYTCQDKAYTETGILGSIADRSFRDFWFSDENRKALAAINPREHCAHHCVAESKNRLLHDILSLDRDHAPFV
jgi:MoaA/NifB/PqqE/SkfB family radical SAM enzyme